MLYLPLKCESKRICDISKTIVENQHDIFTINNYCNSHFEIMLYNNYIE